MWGSLLLENQGEETPPPLHVNNLGSQIFMLGTPLILYVGILYVLFLPPFFASKDALGTPQERGSHESQIVKKCQGSPRGDLGI